MFEYAALVDAPVQRFTGIVTGSDPDDERVALAVATPDAPVAVPVVEAPVMLVAVPPDPMPEPISSPPAPPAPAPVHAPPAARPTLRVATTPAPTREPSFMPALLAVAAAGLTAMWWLRRDSHDRGR